MSKRSKVIYLNDSLQQRNDENLSVIVIRFYSV
jgi:hypothetical protein